MCMVLGNILISFSFCLLKNLPSVPHRGCSQFLVSVKEGSLFSIPSPAVIVHSIFDYGHSDHREVFEVSICISFILTMLTSFHEIFEHCELNLLIQMGFLNTCSVLNIFPMTSPRTFLKRKCFFLKALQALRI